MILEPSTSTKTPVVYISPTGAFGLTSESTIVLSPHFYWCKKSTTPFHSLDQARKVAPSLFENDLKQQHLNYDVYKNRSGEFIFIAYDLGRIKTALQDLGLDFKQIKNIYLAQHLGDMLTQPLRVDEDHALAIVDDIVVCINPAYLNQEPIAIEDFIQEQSFTFKKVPLEGIGSLDLLVYQKPAIIAAILLGLIIILEFINLFSARSTLERQEENLRTKFSLPATQLQLKSIMKRLHTTQTEQSFIRESLYFISKNRTLIKGRLTSMSVSTKSMNLTFSAPDHALTELIKKKFPKAQFSQGKDELIVKVSL